MTPKPFTNGLAVSAINSVNALPYTNTPTTSESIHYRTLGLTTTTSRSKGLRRSLIVVAVASIALTNALLSSPLYGSEINLSAISQIESSGRSSAVGDGGKALGLYQLHAGIITDFNRLNGTQYTHKSALNPITARLIASWAFDTYYPKILRRMGIRPTTDSLIVCFNAGCGALRYKNLPKTTQTYLKKYRSLTK
jgi:hypothetical protein